MIRTRRVARRRQAQSGHPGRRFQAFEVADFAFAEDQDASRPEIFMEAGEREAGLLDVRAGDRPIEAFGAREQFERQAERLGPAGEQHRDGDA